jgi:hypothetical protein
MHHLLGIAEAEPESSGTMGSFVGVGMVLRLLIGIPSVIFPLRAGIRALREMEF